VVEVEMMQEHNKGKVNAIWGINHAN
jgi:hypothetical protein